VINCHHRHRASPITNNSFAPIPCLITPPYLARYRQEAGHVDQRERCFSGKKFFFFSGKASQEPRTNRGGLARSCRYPGHPASTIGWFATDAHSAPFDADKIRLGCSWRNLLESRRNQLVKETKACGSALSCRLGVLACSVPMYPGDASIRFSSSKKGRTGGFSRLFRGQKSTRRRNFASARRHFKRAIPTEICACAWTRRPSSSAVTVRWVTVSHVSRHKHVKRLSFDHEINNRSSQRIGPPRRARAPDDHADLRDQRPKGIDIALKPLA